MGIMGGSRCPYRDLMLAGTNEVEQSSLHGTAPASTRDSTKTGTKVETESSGVSGEGDQGSRLREIDWISCPMLFLVPSVSIQAEVPAQSEQECRGDQGSTEITARHR
jgi:hypothetical protein